MAVGNRSGTHHTRPPAAKGTDCRSSDSSVGWVNEKTVHCAASQEAISVTCRNAGVRLCMQAAVRFAIGVSVPTMYRLLSYSEQLLCCQVLNAAWLTSTA